MGEADLEPLQLTLELTGEAAQFVQLDQALEQVPAQEPLVGMAFAQLRVDRLEARHDRRAEALAQRGEGLLVERDHLALRGRERARLRPLRRRELGRRV